MNGMFGAFWGIIAGPIGIRMSSSNDVQKSRLNFFLLLMTVGSFGCLIGLTLSFQTIFRFQASSKKLLKTIYFETLLLIRKESMDTLFDK